MRKSSNLTFWFEKRLRKKFSVKLSQICNLSQMNRLHDQIKFSSRPPSPTPNSTNKFKTTNDIRRQDGLLLNYSITVLGEILISMINCSEKCAMAGWLAMLTDSPTYWRSPVNTYNIIIKLVSFSQSSKSLQIMFSHVLQYARHRETKWNYPCAPSAAHPCDPNKIYNTQAAPIFRLQNFTSQWNICKYYLLI